MHARVQVATVTALLVVGTAGAAVTWAATNEPAGSSAANPREPVGPGSPDGRTGTSSRPPTSAGEPGAASPARRPAREPHAPRTSAGTATAEDRSPPDGARPADATAMVDATLRIRGIGLDGLTVVAYRGSPDDGPGTRIQDGGVAASPVGTRGGTGPGQIGNYIVTAHRTSGPAPFADLPDLRRGDHVHVRALGRIFDYRLVGTRWTSFRSRRSLAEQAAAVPGRPGAEPTRAMITLSTCATPEDHARGNYWSDEFGNPEHRIDKIGVLVDVRPGLEQRVGGAGRSAANEAAG